MRVAIFSDVHGNLTALEAVLAEIGRESPDLTVFAGDLCLFGARPAQCLTRLRDEGIPAVYGNTDEWIGTRPGHSGVPVDWNRDRIDVSGQEWLASLPFEYRVSPAGRPEDDLLVVHANPLDVNQPIWPPVSRQEELYGEVRQPDEELEPLLGDVSAAVLAFGHVHVPNIRRWGRIMVANISSVSLAQDGDVRAKYGLLTWDRKAGWSAKHRRVKYDMGEEVDALAKHQPPHWQALAERLRLARP